MRWCRFALAVTACLFVWSAPASAILIESRGNKVGGHLVREDAKRLTVRTTGPDGQEVEEEYLLAKIKVLHRLDPKRLESLSRANPRAYSEYADELAREEADPEARYMARRLYLIAASLDPAKYGMSSLLRMSALAGSPAEARRCRALAFALGEKADPKLLTLDDVKPDGASRLPTEALQDFMKSLQLYRAGKVHLAMEAANRRGMDKVFRQAPGNLDQAGFRRMCLDAKCSACKAKGKVRCTACSGQGVIRGLLGGLERCATCAGKKTSACEACAGRGVTADLSEDTLRVVLGAELWATELVTGGRAEGDPKDASGGRKWSSALQKRRVSPVLPLSFETVTEFDPRRCHYRNGFWVLPTD